MCGSQCVLLKKGASAHYCEVSEVHAWFFVVTLSTKCGHVHLRVCLQELTGKYTRGKIAPCNYQLQVRFSLKNRERGQAITERLACAAVVATLAVLTLHASVVMAHPLRANYAAVDRFPR
jgi:hypothetical protein